MKFEDPDLKIETYQPEELGWVYKGDNVYETPDGEMIIFPPKVPHLVQRIVSSRGVV